MEGGRGQGGGWGLGVRQEALEPRMGSSDGLTGGTCRKGTYLAGRQMMLGTTMVTTKCPVVPEHGPWAPDLPSSFLPHFPMKQVVQFMSWILPATCDIGLLPHFLDKETEAQSYKLQPAGPQASRAVDTRLDWVTQQAEGRCLGPSSSRDKKVKERGAVPSSQPWGPLLEDSQGPPSLAGGCNLRVST